MTYELTTCDIMVRVTPEFMEADSDPAALRYLWAYTVEIFNGGPHAVQVMNRHWQITDGFGHSTEVRGKGIIGKQPIIEPGNSFSYTSGAPLATPSGIMGGVYEVRDDNGFVFDVLIPNFSLDSRHDRARVH
ncbi:ApaG protein [hydrothermal vent metagenome]|uniref:Protein ApaG n=1 Tax=hydrothermal vent metagenome TaxID=652676 RepID=A0A3B0S8Q1_9ZZZZ